MRIVYAVIPPSHENRYVSRFGSSVAAPLGFAETFPPQSVSDRGVTVAAPAVAGNTQAANATVKLSGTARRSQPDEFSLPTQTSVVVCVGLPTAPHRGGRVRARPVEDL